MKASKSLDVNKIKASLNKTRFVAQEPWLIQKKRCFSAKSPAGDL
jgi:hypothetical protein